MNDLIKEIDKNLEKFLPEEYPFNLFNSMRYTILLEGKRLRPLLCLEFCRIFGGDANAAMPAACAIEMLHAQTLIHDDLPCMDNDDFRRGKPSNHKVFGVATATLAGDALLTFAPQIILRNSKNLPPEITLAILDDFFTFGGARGVIAGQVIDIECEGSKTCRTEQNLEFIHKHKTADLFRLAVRTGARIARADDENFHKADEFAQNFGMAFQIADDILDVISNFNEMGKTVGKDELENKLTYVSFYGLDNAKCKLLAMLEKCDIMVNGFKSEILEKILRDIRKRVDI